MSDIPIIPGRGLNSHSGIKARQDFLKELGHPLKSISNTTLEPEHIRTNIESFVGSIEIPLGVVGPILYNTSAGQQELAYTVAGTLEGALVASMNRGAKALSQSGGFWAEVKQQKMIRAPMFLFTSLADAALFEKWVPHEFQKIKQVAEEHSNHASLKSLQPFKVENTVHLRFVFQTGDAAGQNMTTTCTWHAMLWIVDHFQQETGIEIPYYIIEGNGSSDKKISNYSITEGRGIHVTAHAFLKEETIQKVLRSTSEAIFRCFKPSVLLSKEDGMVGYNINVANAIAAIFMATGQDMASVHESAVGIFHVEKTEAGLSLSLTLPSLVIGTVGGGTNLARQTEALELMGCKGSGKIKRFAELIAGFALALEVSTYAAIVSGEFAKAHEKLGRNKPVNWLTRSEITTEFLEAIFKQKMDIGEIDSITILSGGIVDNGVITNLTNRVSKKLIGFIPVEIKYHSGGGVGVKKVILKSKALDLEVVKGLHLMAASIDTKLSDLLNRYRQHLEYSNCHIKEIKLYEHLDQAGFDCMPGYFGKAINQKREIYLFAEEFLEDHALEHINSQKKPSWWTEKQIGDTIKAITKVHQHFEDATQRNKIKEVQIFEPWNALPLYEKLVSIMLKEAADDLSKDRIQSLLIYIGQLEFDRSNLKVGSTIIHNDFNSRNIAIRKDGRPCIYDWELAVMDIPHRDIVELLSFVLEEGFTEEQFFFWLNFHHGLYPALKPGWEEWCAAYVYSLKVYLITRVSFYEVAGILDRYAFSERIMNNAFRMLEMLNARV
ncbi:MAG: phosphotransferase [Saprospiraceae bacterium]|nr:phosphotransferase [Saprospiraceae bacterium]